MTTLKKATESFAADLEVTKESSEEQKPNVTLDDIGKVDSLKKYAGFGFAAGLQLTKYNKNAVNEAIVDSDGVIRVTEYKKSSATLVLETHYLFTLPKNSHVGFGPFVAIGIGDDFTESSPVSTMAVGGMMSVRESADSRSGFVIGLGYAVIRKPHGFQRISWQFIAYK